MEDHELELLRRHPQWETVLKVYQQLNEEGQSQNPDFDGWIGRIHDVPEVAEIELPAIHGKLIAFGFLKFDLAGRDGGIRYQLTHLANQDPSSSSQAENAQAKSSGKVHKLKLAELYARSAG